MATFLMLIAFVGLIISVGGMLYDMFNGYEFPNEVAYGLIWLALASGAIGLVGIVL